MDRTEAELRRRVGGVSRKNTSVGDRADRDDVTALPLFHVAEEGANKEKRGDEIGVDRPDEEVGRRLLDNGDSEDAGIVDEDVWRIAELRSDLLRRPLHILGVRYITRDGNRSFETLGGFLQCGFVAGEQYDPRALPRECR